MCVGAHIAIEGINIVLEAGLYNSACGTVVNIAYDSVAGPNSQHEDHLPLYVAVGFPGLRLGCAKPWDKDNHTVGNRKDQRLALIYPLLCHAHNRNRNQHVPIRPQEVLCNKVAALLDTAHLYWLGPRLSINYRVLKPASSRETSLIESSWT